MENLIIKWLFQTKAIQVCSEDMPFWYTSGTLGPYYINTHFLYGSKLDAEDILEYMGVIAGEKDLYPSRLYKKISEQYDSNEIFREVINLIVVKSKELSFDFISGGERRDFFFSIMAAKILKKPHVSIFKDGTMFESDFDFTKSTVVTPDSLNGKKALHIADLVTEASSYLRAWIPAIKFTGACISSSIAIVDRDQGGREALESNEIAFYSFALIQKDLFKNAFLNNYINEKQYLMICDFIDSPKIFMTNFIKSHPNFLDNQINAGGKAKERALLFIEKGLNL